MLPKKAESLLKHSIGQRPMKGINATIKSAESAKEYVVTRFQRLGLLVYLTP